MTAASMATLGVICDSRAISMATIGVICGDAAIIAPPQVEIPSTGGGRGTGRIDPYGYNKHRDDDLAQTRKRKILQEDDEIIALIMSMVTEGLI